MECEELLDRWRGGDAQAGQQLLARHYPSVRRFFANKGGAAAEDLVQETLSRCVRGRDRFDGRSSYRSYVLGVARYVLYEHLRGLSQTFDHHVTSIEAVDPSPSQLIRRDDQRRLIQTCMRRLPVEQQIALELHYWEGLAIAEIAEVLELPLGTAKSRVRMARLALERLLEQFEVSLEV